MLKLLKKLLDALICFIKKRLSNMIKKWLIAAGLVLGLAILVIVILWIIGGSSP